MYEQTPLYKPSEYRKEQNWDFGGDFRAQSKKKKEEKTLFLFN